MPVRAIAFAEEEKTVDVPTKHGTLHVRYRPNALTPKQEEELARLAKEDPESSEPTVILFCKLIAHTDLVGPLYDEDDVDDEGNPRQVVAPDEPVRPIPEHVRHLKGAAVAILEAVQEDMGGGDPNRRSRPSRGGSFSRR